MALLYQLAYPFRKRFLAHSDFIEITNLPDEIRRSEVIPRPGGGSAKGIGANQGRREVRAKYIGPSGAKPRALQDDERLGCSGGRSNSY
jgi:hypothetical protein